MNDQSINRIEILRKYIDETLLNMTDVVERRCAYLHLYGVAQSYALIVLKREENVELAVMAEMLHDIYSYAMMDTVDHAHDSTTSAREILTGLQITNDAETEMICDAVYTYSDVKAGLEKQKAALLVVIVGLLDGRKVVLAVEPGYRKSTESWSEVLRDIKERGMNCPCSATGDGNLGIWGALANVYPGALEQRCWNHKMVNVLDKLPKKLQD